MKSGKAAGPSGISAEHLKYLNGEGIEWVKELLNRIVKEEKTPTEWTKTYIVIIYKEKGDPIQCKNYRGTKLLEHGLKLLEKTIDRKLRELVSINRMQFGFSKGKGSTNAIFILRQVQEKMLEKKKAYMAFLDLEKAYDSVPRGVVYWCLQRKGVPEQMVRMVQATYKEVTTRVRTDCGKMEEFGIEMGLQQGSALSPFLFITIMDTLTKDVRFGYSIGANFCR